MIRDYQTNMFWVQLALRQQLSRASWQDSSWGTSYDSFSAQIVWLCAEHPKCSFKNEPPNKSQKMWLAYVGITFFDIFWWFICCTNGPAMASISQGGARSGRAGLLGGGHRLAGPWQVTTQAFRPTVWVMARTLCCLSWQELKHDCSIWSISRLFLFEDFCNEMIWNGL